LKVAAMTMPLGVTSHAGDVRRLEPRILRL
jgi:hypothetical protein